MFCRGWEPLLYDKAPATAVRKELTTGRQGETERESLPFNHILAVFAKDAKHKDRRRTRCGSVSGSIHIIKINLIRNKISNFNLT